MDRKCLRKVIGPRIISIFMSLVKVAKRRKEIREKYC
jgi:hypothetical protein